MSTYSFHIVDVFAERKYRGNQLAVVMNAKSLTTDQMQEIALEMNYSETTFILSPQSREGGYDVRIFTPQEEVPFAGHPTLGTAFIIQREILKKQVEQLLLNLKVGQIPVDFTYRDQQPDLLWMTQNTPVFKKKFSAHTIAQILNLNPDDIDQRFPVQEVSTGLPFIIAPLKTLAAVKKSAIDKVKFFQLIRNIESKAILVFSPECYDHANQLNVRVYVDYFGIPEDPATGSANGCLAGYLAKYKYFGENHIDVRVEQGMEINRPSLLFLKARQTPGETVIQVGGKTVAVARGELL
jgi:trans-2,3-dihydro-3-hydroxyanthranilate isomerase